MTYQPHEYVRPPDGYSSLCVECGFSSRNPVHDLDEDPTAGFLIPQDR